MGCESCGEKKKCAAESFTKAVVEINNPEALVLLRKVSIPASMGDDTTVPPAVGKYRNVILQYEASDALYLYSSDGIPTKIDAKIPQEVLDQIATLENDVAELGQEIEDLKNSPDVVDVVATYAALQEYDTSALGDKDVIRVLADETHDGQSTYYRWNASAQSWTFIGTVGDYYTKQQVDALLANTPAFKPFPASVNTTGTTQQFLSSILALDAEVGTAFLDTVSLSDMPAGLIQEEVAVYVYNDYVVYAIMRSTDVAPYEWWCSSYNYGGWRASGGTTYSAGDAIDITNNVISATNTGKAKLLTTADYDYPTGSPTSIAAWKLDAGVYRTSDGTKVQYSTTAAEYFANGPQIIIVVTDGGDNARSIHAFEQDKLYSYLVKSTGEQWFKNRYLYRGDVVDDLYSIAINVPLSANQGRVLNDKINGRITQNAGAPTTSTVGTVGQLLEDTTNGKLYQCTAIDTTDPQNPSYTWSEVGGGSGVTVVQTNGTSTTDVMSQKAVTDLLFNNNLPQKVQIGSGSDSSFTGNGGAVAIGGSRAAANNTIAIGTTAGALAGDAIILGRSSSSSISAANGVAIGRLSSVTGESAVALGARATATQKGQFDISTGTATWGYNNSSYRLLTGLYDPQSAHDAATKGYVDAISSYSETEADTGATWIDGKTIYKKSYQQTITSNSQQFNLDITNLYEVVKIEAIWHIGGTLTNGLPTTFATTSSINDNVTVLTYGGQAQISSNGRNGTKGVITFYYTKSS